MFFPVMWLIASMVGTVSPMVASTEPRKMFTERCNWFAMAGLYRADCLRRSHQNGNEDAAHRRGGMYYLDHVIYGLRQLFRQKDHRQHVGGQQHDMRRQ